MRKSSHHPNPLSTITLALAGLAAHALAHSSPLAHRKSLGFGPDLPHARFQSVNLCTASPPDPTRDPYAVARDFLRPYNVFQAGRTCVIRPNSYTDYATGVTHVYIRQFIGGIKVTNAHINLNNKDGRVLSFGDSVCRATTIPAVLSSSHAIPMLSLTASLAHVKGHSPGQGLGQGQARLLPPMISETISDVRSVSKGGGGAPGRTLGDLTFGQARLRDLIKKYQG